MGQVSTRGPQLDKRIASPQIKDDHLARELIGLLDDWEEELQIREAVIYYDFPLFRDEGNGFFRPTLLLASRTHGLAAIEIVPSAAPSGPDVFSSADNKLSQIDSIIFGKLLRSRELRVSKRDIALQIGTIVYTDSRVETQDSSHYQSEIVDNQDSLKATIQQQKQSDLTDTQWTELLSILEGSKGINRSIERDPAETQPGSRGAALARLEGKIANFDKDQRLAAITLVDGPQRIRGLAGSGKTIVLAMKAAHIHLQNPDATVLFTFWTRSLYDLTKQLITRFYRQFDDRDPDWERLHVLHAWGGKQTSGVYFNSCIDAGLSPLSFRDVPAHAKHRFGYVCDHVLKSNRIRQKYDYILIDEGQDFPLEFYRLCFELTKGGPTDRNIIWAYDELQTIMDTEVQKVSDTFGHYPDGTARMDLDRAQTELSHDLLPHDVILHRCYRNPPEVLVTAHALGFGIYADQQVQRLEDSEHWEALGYVVEEGTCTAGEFTRIRRPPENSPLDATEYISKEDIIRYSKHDDFESEADWASTEILSFLDDGLRPEDILVVAFDDRNARGYFGAIARRLSDRDVNVNNVLAAPYGQQEFRIENHVTLSTVYRAKGNEAAVVIGIGIDALGLERNLRRARNKLFTTLTRAKVWLRLSGMGNAAQILFDEISAALSHFPYLEFVYPDRDTIETIQRDLSEKSRKIDRLRETLVDLDLTDMDEKDLLEAARLTRKKREE